MNLFITDLRLLRCSGVSGGGHACMISGYVVTLQRHGRVTALKLSMKQIRPLTETWCRSIQYLHRSIARSSGSRAQCLARRSNSR
jgi:hypothetical protein